MSFTPVSLTQVYLTIAPESHWPYNHSYELGRQYNFISIIDGFCHRFQKCVMP